VSALLVSCASCWKYCFGFGAVASGIGCLGGAVERAIAVGGARECAFVLGQSGVRLSQLEQEITQKLA
jgi:hypothetical protein